MDRRLTCPSHEKRLRQNRGNWGGEETVPQWKGPPKGGPFPRVWQRSQSRSRLGRKS